MQRIVVLGAGLVGSAMVKDLSKDYEILAVDYSEAALQSLAELSNVKIQQADLSVAQNVIELCDPADLVICAVPGAMGFDTLKAIIEAGKNVVDISFFPEDPFELDALAKEKDVTAIVDCGVAPGLCNMQAGYVASQLDEVERYVCYVGGLPVVREWPYEYRAVFSPADVIEEYVRPARYIAHGQEVVMPALTEPELIEFPGIGTLEAFNTDGLRSLATTINAPFMKEKTLRYAGHIELMRVFRESGFFSQTPIDLNGQQVVPLEMTSRLIFDQWKMPEGGEDFTVMQVVIEGLKDGKRLRYTFDLLDRYHQETQVTSMARTTGYTATVTARLVLNGDYKLAGISPPEIPGMQPGFYPAVVEGLAARDIEIHETLETL